MSRTTKTEQEALFQAIVKLSGDADKQYYPHICSLYDRITGAKYSTCNSTFEFIAKINKEVQKGINL